MSINIPMNDNGAGKPERKKDPWSVTDDDEDDYQPWSTRTTKEKISGIATNILKIIFVFAFLYLFICSLGLMGSAFQVLAGKTAGDLFSQNEILANPVAGVIIGILVTVLVQSSSTSTSIFITMTSVGLTTVPTGIPLIMGANIGTSVTNTIVSLSQSINRDEFRRAFAGATVHDIFNLLSVIILLPIELIFGYLEKLTDAILAGFVVVKGQKPPKLLKVITKPLTKKIISVNKTVITLAATDQYLEPDSSMVVIWCDSEEREINVTVRQYYNESEGSGSGFEPYMNLTTPQANYTELYENVTTTINVTVGTKLCDTNDFLFANTGMSDPAVGSILLVVSLIAMCICLVLMVKLLTSMMKGSIARIIKKVLNTNFPYPFGWLTGYLTILVGAGLTFLVQSSSVFTSTMTPLVGIGVISLKRMFPLTLGSNIGTTTTGLLAALASSGNELKYALQLALCHFFFNITGIIIWYPIPYIRRIPIGAAKALGNKTAKHRWFAVAYLIFAFFLLPAVLLGFSILHEWALWGLLIVVVLTVIPIIVISKLQSKRPGALPEKLRDWTFLPLWMHSMKPFDNMFKRCCACSERARRNSSLSRKGKDANHLGEVNANYENPEDETRM